MSARSRCLRTACGLTAAALLALLTTSGGIATPAGGDRSTGVPAASSVGAAASVGTGAADQRKGPRGRTARSWAWLSSDEWRWGTCELTWSYDPTGGLESTGHVRQAVARVEAASGFAFRKVPVRKAADISIRWVSPRQDPSLRGGTAGFALVYPSSSGGRVEIGSAEIHLDRTERQIPRGFVKRRGTWGSLTMHEVGHAVGLGHTADRHQVMSEHTSVSSWGRGDRAGLSAVSSGC